MTSYNMLAVSDGCLEAQVRCVTQVWILKGRNDEVYRGMWVRAMDEMLARLVGFAENDQLHYVGDINGYVRAHIVPTHVAPRFSITVFRSLGTAVQSQQRHLFAKDHLHNYWERALRIDNECYCLS